MTPKTQQPHQTPTRTKSARRFLTAAATAATTALLLTPTSAFAATGGSGGAPKPPAPKPAGPVQTTTKVTIPKVPTTKKPLTIGAHVSPAHRAAPGSPAETGTVTFTVDGQAGTPIPLKSAKAAEKLKLPAGQHTIDAKYSGDATHSASDSGPVTVTVS